MVVGFVNSGLMTLGASIYIIMGANVGTTVTAWLISLTGLNGSAWYIQLFKPSTFTPVLAVIGIVIFMTTKKKKMKDVASILLGFAVLMFGMEMMSDAVAPLSDMPSFTRLFTMFSNPILGVLAGAVLTAIIQSSSASVGILQALSLTGAIPFSAALPIIMGQNIGTCITAVLSSVGTTKDARRASIVHLYFNCAGTLIWLTVYVLVDAIVDLPISAMVMTPFLIAVTHSIYNVLTTALLFPFGKTLEKLARLTIRDGGKGEDEIPMLDERLFVTPAIALERAHTVLNEMGELSFGIMQAAIDQLERFDAKQADAVVEGESKADMYEDKLGTYLVQLSGHEMSESDSHEMNKYLHMIGDLERISDHAVNIVESAREIHEKKIVFSEGARNELAVITRAVREILNDARRTMQSEDLEVAAKVEPLEQVIDLLNKSIRARHIDRLTHNECTIELGFILNDILTNLERVSDHCSNLAVCIIEIAHNSFDTHEYLSGVKHNQGEFIAQYEQYKERFALPPVKA